MIDSLYEPFRHWSKSGSVYILSDTHFEDSDCKLMCKTWITPEEQLDILKKMCHKCDTLIHLGDVGNPEYLRHLKCKKVLICGNHDAVGEYRDYFDEIYTGPLMISPKILLSHEPIPGLTWCVNIHGHDHSGIMRYTDALGAVHLNLAANVCKYTPISLGAEIKNGLTSKTKDIHRITIDRAILKASKKNK